MGNKKTGEMTTDLQNKLVQCERQQRELWAYRPLSQDTLRSLQEYYRVGLTYTSNALEGNSLTETETKVVIEDGLTIEGKPLRDVYEAVGHAKAYDFLYEISHDAPPPYRGNHPNDTSPVLPTD